MERETTQQKCSPDTPIMATKANKQKQQQSEETRPKWTNNNKVNKQQQTATINTWFGLLSNVYYIHAYLVKLLNNNI